MRIDVEPQPVWWVGEYREAVWVSGTVDRKDQLMSLRVKGHALQHEGAPFCVNEDGEVVRVYARWGGVVGYGRGLCQCGALSPMLDSGAQRKAWHREHKREVSA